MDKKTSISLIIGIIGTLASLGIIKSDYELGIKIPLVIIIGGIVIWFIVQTILQTNKKHKQLREENAGYIKDKLDNDYFGESWKDRLGDEPYVEMDYQWTSPTLDKEGDSAKRYPLKKAFVKGFFQPMHRGSKYALILGDSGSGKTTALANLLIDYVNHYKAKSLPYDIQIYSLGNENVWNKIANDFEGKEKEKCILLLDALDENEDAQVYSALKGTKEYMAQLAEQTKDFARVVVTCRSQFFKDEESLPGIIRKGKDSIQGWDKYYLSLFNKGQIESYLSQKFVNDPRYKKALEIVYNSPDFCRPLILSWIGEIVDRIPVGEKPSLKDIYTYIIASWINREAKDEAGFNALMNFSIALAHFMYRNGLSSVGEEQYQQFLKEYGIEDKDDLYRGRSLLNRGADGYKFSHRSFYEYFLANIFFNYPGEIQSVQGLDFAVRIFDELYEEYQQTENHTEEEDFRVAAALYNLGLALKNLNHHKEAEKEYSAALAIFRQLAEKNPDKYLPDVAMTLNNLANLHSDTHHYEEAEKEYQEALRIRKPLAEKNPDKYLPDVADTLENLAVLHSDTHHYEEAEKEYQEVLGIRKPLAEKNPEDFLPKVAQTLNNLAILHWNTHHYEEAEKEYQEVLGIRKPLAEKNPEDFLPKVAQTLNNLAILHSNTQNYEDAEKEFQEALDTYRKLAEKNPDAYLPRVADTLNNLAALHYSTQNYKKAEKEYQEALEISKQLAEKYPDAYLPDVAQTLYNIALLHLELGHLKEALAAAQESLEKYSIMAEISHEAFGKYVEKASELVEIIRSQLGKGKKR